MKQKMASN